MGLKSLLAKPFADYIAKRVYDAAKNAVANQEKIMMELVQTAAQTQFGKDHHFSNVRNYEDFKAAVPVRDYEALRYYIDKMVDGESDVLWPGKPLYLAKTSGTTSGVKYIPLTKASIPNHINSARNALLMYVHETRNTDFISGKMIFLQGSPVLGEKNGIKTGRLSGIVYHFVPGYLLRNRMPSYTINCIEDWETKVEAIAHETMSEKMSLISGIPPWVLMYFEKLTAISGKKTVQEIFPDFSLFVYGGVNYEPYRSKIEAIVGKKIPSIETYPASEGFIAYQDSQNAEGLLLNVDSGIFFEFIPAGEIFNDNPTRVMLKDVQLGVNYALILNNNAGLWGYNIGDTIKFVSLNPYRIVVSGRIKHFISAFGEHVIGEEVEYALLKAAEEEQIEIVEFTVAPQVNPESGLPYHEWFIEFGTQPTNLTTFAAKVDEHLQHKNIYYKDLITGKILRSLEITLVKEGGFRNFMKAKGKLGGQNKVARLSNDRLIADELKEWTVC
ncbi:MAG: GH3 auxin-responsive promoter family protein [Chitinophagales bacterium]|nr:GH3 auxin-responsive promoter family protein [Bacteroidota bacterium]MBK9554372.1 GH3 auxin-responsive promoter family protein [Bacteroidota bacterium]MBL0280020.1 GH3 auxin-responsive promoter family protein [Bacteroidota bacterium]MBP8249911.1 GH3 auxin-responsive promoter family protein [Chitinophagales bacterium]